MYDAALFQKAFVARGLNYFHLGRLAGVDPKTAKLVVETGVGRPISIYKIASALGFNVKKFGEGEKVYFDFTAIEKKPVRRRA